MPRSTNHLHTLIFLGLQIISFQGMLQKFPFCSFGHKVLTDTPVSKKVTQIQMQSNLWFVQICANGGQIAFQPGYMEPLGGVSCGFVLFGLVGYGSRANSVLVHRPDGISQINPQLTAHISNRINKEKKGVSALNEWATEIHCTNLWCVMD